MYRLSDSRYLGKHVVQLVGGFICFLIFFYKICIIIIIISIFFIKCLNIDCNGRAVTRSFLEREVSSSNLEAVKSEIL